MTEGQTGQIQYRPHFFKAGYNYGIAELRKDRANPVKPPLFQSGAIITEGQGKSSTVPTFSQRGCY